MRRAGGGGGAGAAAGAATRARRTAHASSAPRTASSAVGALRTQPLPLALVARRPSAEASRQPVLRTFWADYTGFPAIAQAVNPGRWSSLLRPLLDRTRHASSTHGRASGSPRAVPGESVALLASDDGPSFDPRCGLPRDARARSLHAFLARRSSRALCVALGQGRLRGSCPAIARLLKAAREQLSQAA